MSNLQLIDYSERAVAVFGSDTKTYKDNLIGAGGKFNPSLKFSETERKAGWIFPKSKKAILEKLLGDINSGSVEKPAEKPAKKEYKHDTGNDDLHKIIAQLASRVERLEQELTNLKDSSSSSSAAAKPAATITFAEDSGDEPETDEEPQVNMKRLLKRK